MTIETKFNIQKEVYVVYFDWSNNKIEVKQTIIEAVNILPYLQNSAICYNYGTSLGTFEENEIYNTREEAEQKLREIKNIFKGESDESICDKE